MTKKQHVIPFCIHSMSRRPRRTGIRTLLTLTLLGGTLAGCNTTMAPEYETPPYAQALMWRELPGYESSAGQRAATQISWREFYQSPELQLVIFAALQNNKDLKLAALSIEEARALYRIKRSDLFPKANANGGITYNTSSDESSSTGRSVNSRAYNANIGLSSYEIDLFGRVRSNNDAALNEYLSTEAAKETVEITLIAETANAYLQLLTDQKLLALTEKTLEAQKNTLSIVSQSQTKGIGTKQDVARAQTAVESAQVNYHQFQRFVEQDKNALIVLMGIAYDETLIPENALEDIALVSDINEGLPAETLISRPDIRQAELVLMARNADIGAARAAFFPRISLTGTYGYASQHLSDLLVSGAFGAWTFVPQITLPIFQAGENQANLDLAKIRKDKAIISYEKTIENAFSEVADELAARETLVKQLKAQRRLVEAAQKVYDISQARYKSGVDSFLSVLDAQRELYTHQQNEIKTEQQRLANQVNLYKVLGGGLKATEYPVTKVEHSE